MKQKVAKKLRLNRETIRSLNDEQLKNVDGGTNFTFTCFGTTCGSACCPVTE